MRSPAPKPPSEEKSPPETGGAGRPRDTQCNEVPSTTAPLAFHPAAVIDEAPRSDAERRRLALGITGAILGVLTMPFPAQAGTLPEAEARAIQIVIQAQIQAFKAGQAERAFSFASEAIRAQFGDAATFLAMVQAGYPMLLRPSGLSFFVPEVAKGDVVQKVQVRDVEGRLWDVTYQLQPQPDKTWRINGCGVVPAARNSSA